MINVGASVKNIIHVKKFMFGILQHAIAKMDDLVITCDEVIEKTKTIPTYFNEKK